MLPPIDFGLAFICCKDLGSTFTRFKGIGSTFTNFKQHNAFNLEVLQGRR
jgi:hypothetical protein